MASKNSSYHGLQRPRISSLTQPYSAERLRKQYRIAKRDAQCCHWHEAELEAENALLRTWGNSGEDEHSQLWKISPSLLLEARLDGVLIDVNPAWTTSLGWTEQELVGCNLFDLIHPAESSEIMRGVECLSDGPAPGRFVSRCRHKSGAYRWISWVAGRCEDYFVAAGHDLTVEKDLAAALENAEAALRQSMKMEAIGQLTGGLAHDFNNLLIVITGNLELLQTRIDQGQTCNLTPYIVAAQAASKRAATLAHRLLAFSRRQSHDPKPTNLNEVLSKWRN
jgi:PAS domain S-box-containing protein